MTINIYIGFDFSQALAAKVLKYSIEKNSNDKIKISFIDNSEIPIPKDQSNKAKTPFSFSRFLIPGLNNFSGKAIYFDSDMLVFDDVKKLIDLNLNEKKISMLKIKNIKHTSVLVLDCSKLSWDINQIIQSLDKKEYSYDELMVDLIIEKNNIIYNLPPTWNSLDYFDADTSLIHYTNLDKQPWSTPLNKYGYLWINILKEMLLKKIITYDDIRADIKKKYVRPSLIIELKMKFMSKNIFFKYFLKTYDKISNFEPFYKKYQKIINK